MKKHAAIHIMSARQLLVEGGEDEIWPKIWGPQICQKLDKSGRPHELWPKIWGPHIFYETITSSRFKKLRSFNDLT